MENREDASLYKYMNANMHAYTHIHICVHTYLCICVASIYPATPRTCRHALQTMKTDKNDLLRDNDH